MKLTEEQREWQLKARKFAEAEIRPISLGRDRILDPRETFDWDIIIKGSELGFRTCAVPKEWGGAGLDFVGQALVMMELARGDSAIAKTFSQCWKWSHLMAASCTQAQRDEYLVPFMKDHTYLLGKAGTEEVSGSDNRMLPDDPSAGWMMRAEQDGDHWILNGRKKYIANGSVGKLFFVDTRTDPTVNLIHGTTLFMVTSVMAGFRVGQVFDKIGWRFYQNAELIFEDVRVPAVNIVGEVNGGVQARRGDTSEFGDMELAANATGVCDAALEMALAHAKTRKQGGMMIAGHQAIQLKLSEMNTITEALRAFVFQTAMGADEGNLRNNLALMNFATDVVQRVTQLNMDIHGGAGVMKDVGAEKLFRDASIWTHLAGDSVQRLRAFQKLS